MIKIKELTQEQFETILKHEEAVLSERNKEFNNLKLELQKQHQRVDSLLIERDRRKLDQNKTDWSWLIEKKPDAGIINYEDVKQAVESLAIGKTGLVGLRTEMDLKDTRQIKLTMYLCKNDKDLAVKVTSALSMLLPFIKPQEFNDQKYGIPLKAKVIKIMDKNLAKTASYEAYIYEPTNTYIVVENCFYRQDLVYNGKNLDDLVNYIREHYYYETGEPTVIYSAREGWSI